MADITDQNISGDNNEPEIQIIDDSPESGIEALRQQVAEATRRAEAAEREREDEKRARQIESEARVEAERRVHQVSEEVRATRSNASDAQYDSVLNALSAAENELKSTKSAYTVAMAEGDFEKAADLAADIGLVASRVREFQAGKTALEQRRQAGEQHSGYQQQQPQDPRESYLRDMPPKTAAWLRRNDRFFSDRQFQRRVQLAAEVARDRRIEHESDDYFRFIEEQTGLRDPEPAPRNEAEVTATPTNPTSAAGNTAPPRMPSAPAAGANSQSNTSSSRGGKEVRLTAEEMDICRALEISPAKYAQQKVAAIARGEMTGAR